MAKITIEIDTGDKEGMAALAQMFGTFGNGKTVVANKPVKDATGGGDSEVVPPAPEEEVPAEKKVKEKLNGRWSLKYDKCISCGRTDRKHGGKGLCINCYVAKHKYPDTAIHQEEVKEARELMGHGVCQNPACPYDPSDYRAQDMIIVENTAYCSEECAAEARK